MAKKLDLNKPVFELVQEYPELVDVLKDLGFSEITKPAMLNSVGRITTIPKGAKMRNISMMKVVPALMSNGFELIGKMPNIFALGKNNAGDETSSEDGAFQENTREKIKSYLKRLGEGEDLESVRKDFVENFSEVEASEIMKAEQELIKEGTPITEVQKLCDVHSALFHGATKEEKIANAEKAVEESLKKEETSKKLMPDAYNQKHAAAKTLRETVGHPMYRWALENEKIAALIHEIQGDIESGNDVGEKLSELRQISIHYAEKGDLVYPVLKVRYEISGPSDVMWTVDDEIRDELAALDKISDYDEEWMNLVEGSANIANSKLFIDDTPGITLSAMRSKCRKLKMEHDIQIVIIDYLQLMSGNSGNNASRQQEISDISRGLKALARELNVPVIALSQLSRAVEQRPDHRPMLSDLRESGAIEQDADVVMFLYREGYYNRDLSEAEQRVAEVIIAKQRNGPIGTVNLLWIPELTKFTDMDREPV